MGLRAYIEFDIFIELSLPIVIRSLKIFFFLIIYSMLANKELTRSIMKKMKAHNTEPGSFSTKSG